MKELLKSTVIAYAAIRMIQNFDESFKRNKSVIKIADALSKGISKRRKASHDVFIVVEKAKRIELQAMKNANIATIYTKGTNTSIDPVTFCMLILEYNRDIMERNYKLNYKHVDKLANLVTYDKTIDTKYLRKADEFLSVFHNELNQFIEQL